MNIVIVGGGTAGWMAASYLSKFTNANIRVIESQKIPIIGVGESVTPHVAYFFDELGIDRHEWMKHTAAIYKYANKFVGWKEGKGEAEYFSFTYTSPATNFYKDIPQNITLEEFSSSTQERTSDYLVDMFKNKEIDRFDRFFNPQFHYMENNVAPFDGNTHLLNEPFSFSQHINAEFAGIYLKDHIAIPNGVEHKFATVEQVDYTDNTINSVVLDDGEVVTADLFVDCTGFHKALINKLDWPEKLYKNNLIDSAWVCQTDYTDVETEAVNYTQSIAEPHGWRFKIGLFHRMGNGYCFSSKHVSDEDALAHFEKQIGPQRVKPRLIKWTPKRLDIFGKGNVAAVGLSCGFVEPLEANALYTIITSIRSLCHDVINPAKKSNEFNFDTFNKKMAYTIDDIADFILVHYTLSSRDDTDFWRDMRVQGNQNNHQDLIWSKYNNPLNSMQGAADDYTMFPDFMWAQLAISWGCYKPFEKELDPITKELAKMHFYHRESKHKLVSSTRTNNYKWLKSIVFDNLTAAEWEKKYL